MYWNVEAKQQQDEKAAPAIQGPPLEGLSWGWLC